MILISHRGNLDGRLEEKENDPDYINEALKLGFNVEIDVWVESDKFYLGHDRPTYIIDESFLENEKLWCHAKNIESLEHMLKNKKIHCFWHQNDDFTITSNGFIWTYPNKKLTSKSICVLPEIQKEFIVNTKKFYGICSDYILKY
jgi:hypothetical protein